MAYGFPRCRPISSHTQVDAGIVFDEFAHGHLARLQPVAFARFPEPGVGRCRQLAACPRFRQQLLNEVQVLGESVPKRLT